MSNIINELYETLKEAKKKTPVLVIATLQGNLSAYKQQQKELEKKISGFDKSDINRRILSIELNMLKKQIQHVEDVIKQYS
ncbi:MAG: hypothetical protein ACTSRU_19185 [Candidatus Hodarchaeales archaeon]